MLIAGVDKIGIVIIVTIGDSHLGASVTIQHWLVLGFKPQLILEEEAK